MSKPHITITRTEGTWTFGTVGNCLFEVKHFQNPSRLGIDGGRISKLRIIHSNGCTPIAVYD